MVIFVIPAYNEEENIENLLSNTHNVMAKEGLPHKIIVINDGSTDSTKKIVEELKNKMPVEIYSHYPNKGIGEAFRVGFHRALEASRDGDIIITKEADNTSDLNIIKELIFQINNGYDVALASCYARGGCVLGTSLFRRILS